MKDSRCIFKKKNDGGYTHAIPRHHLPSLHYASYNLFPFSSSCPMLSIVLILCKQSTHFILVPSHVVWDIIYYEYGLCFFLP
eukprot:c2062_g1_i1 orf=3-245(-)